MRLRITFAKQDALRYTGHLDLHKMWERTARRAGLPLAYSRGFHPHPQIQLAAALPLGFSSRCEVVDMTIEGETDLGALPAQLQSAVPSGLQIMKVEQVDEKSAPLQTLAFSAEYEVTLPDPVDADALAARIAGLLAAASAPRERRGKAYDLRPLIEELRLIEPERERNPIIFMRLAARPGATGRPEEILDVLGIAFEGTRIERTRLHFSD